MTKNIETIITDLKNPHMNPIPAIEMLAEKEQESTPRLIQQLKLFRETMSTSCLSCLTELFSKARKKELVKARRIVIALGAIKTSKAIPVLLETLTYPIDMTLGRAISWSVANMGEAAVEPLFIFSRSRGILVSARSMAIATLGYIQDPRIPSILRGLWKQYRLEVPELVISGLAGMILHGQEEEARKLAMETESLWHFQGNHDDYLENYWDNLIFETSIERLKSTIERVKPAKNFPKWPEMITYLESA